AVLALPEALQLLAQRVWLIDRKPEKRLSTERDDVPALPVVDQQLAQQRLETALDRHRPGLVAHRLVRHGVEPEKARPGRQRRGEIRRFRAVQMPMEQPPHQLASGANEGRAVAHLLATRIAAEEAEWRA